MIITFLIILFVQGLNCFLEIGFLANNLEENNLRKYRIIGNEIKRKLNISLIFGKTLAQLNYDKLLKNIIPEDIENLHIIDNTNRIVYSAKETAGHNAFRMANAFKREKDFESYTIFIPLSDREAVRGNLVLVVSTRETKDKLLSLVRSSVLNFLLILALSLPLLYALLTWFINRPYKAYLSRIETCAAKCDFAGLKKRGHRPVSLKSCRNDPEGAEKGPMAGPGKPGTL